MQLDAPRELYVPLGQMVQFVDVDKGADLPAWQSEQLLDPGALA